MTRATEQLADELEEHASNRADFHNLSDEERQQVAGWLVRSRSQANASNADFDDLSYRRHMQDKKNAFMYTCGAVGIDIDEARTLWLNVVYGGVAPVDREAVV